VTSATDRAALAAQLAAVKRFGFDLQASSPDPRNASVLGLSFSLRPHSGFFVPVAAVESAGVLDQFRPVLESLEAEKIGHNLKFAIHVLKRHNVQLRGTLFDTMVAHSLVEPDMRHSLEYIAEALLGYTPATLQKLSGRGADEETSLSDLTAQAATEFAAEKADVALQLQGALEPVLKQRLQERVFYQIEAPLLPVLACMEYEGIRIDALR
jgi:DNA polymerase-1